MVTQRQRDSAREVMVRLNADPAFRAARAEESRRPERRQRMRELNADPAFRALQAAAASTSLAELRKKPEFRERWLAGIKAARSKTWRGLPVLPPMTSVQKNLYRRIREEKGREEALRLVFLKGTITAARLRRRPGPPDAHA